MWICRSLTADERGGVVRLHDDVDVEQRLRLAVKRVEVLDFNSDAHRGPKLPTEFRAAPRYAPQQPR